MNKQLSPGVLIGAIVLVVIVVVALGVKFLGSTQENVSPEQQIKMMQHMKK